MNARYGIIAVLIAIGAAAGGYWWARRDMPEPAPAQPAERQVLYWYDPMVPNQHFDEPGKSPFMDMELVPMYAEEQADEASNEPASIQIDPAIVQNLGVRLTTVQRGAIAAAVQAVGALTYNQRKVMAMQARTSGFVTRVFARAPGDVVAKDAPLVELLVPEWSSAQAEYLALLQQKEPALSAAARQRLLLLGMDEALIAELERTRRPSNSITLRAAMAGEIVSLDAREGMTVSAGAPLVTLNALDSVWLEAAIPETQAAQVKLHQEVAVELSAFPGKSRSGRVIALLPQLDVDTRTLRLRIELPNSDGALRPGMFATARFAASDEPVLYVASEAIILSGTRALVLVAEDQGRFTPTPVQPGAEVSGNTVILDGPDNKLGEGQRVVASGQFLIDSEANLKGVLERMSGDAARAGHAEHAP